MEEEILYLKTFEAIPKVKSVRRAIRRGHVSDDGFIYPKRPFNNRKVLNKRGVYCRFINEAKKAYHQGIKEAKIYNKNHPNE